MTIFELGGLVATGLVAGFAGGLFGIGGGVIIVPALYAVFLAGGVPADLCIKLAVGTSLATIIVTSIRSLQGHQRHGNVDWTLLRRWGPWIAVGALGGAALARFATAQALTLFFGCMLLLLAFQKLMVQTKDAPEGQLPGPLYQHALGAGVGIVSSLLGIGGGVLGVLLLTRFGRTVHRAVGTAAGFGLAIAVPGAVGYAIAGLSVVENIPWTIGFISLPAFAAIAVGTAVAAPLGANAATRLSARMLNRVFAIYMIVTSIVMIRDGLTA